MSREPEIRYEAFEPDTWSHVLGRSIERHPRFWIRMGNLETRVFSDSLKAVPLTQPIYVSGLARAGTTILLEMLAGHDATVTHRYRDYPLVFTPCWWNRFLDRMPRREQVAVERSHHDGIRVSADSPEAFEEMLWMAFFPAAHDPAVSQVLDGSSTNPGFEAFYRDHIRKLLVLRGGSRYLAKGNYNLTRLEYLLGLFPDARFVLAVRDPVWHIASLIKQHTLFCAAERAHPWALDYMRRAGHFEFGLDRRPINTGDSAVVSEVQACWNTGREVEGWARYWAYLHGYLADRLEANPELRRAVLIVRHEELCNTPVETLVGVFTHCRLDAAAELIARESGTLRSPTYYKLSFDSGERALIERLTAATAHRFGYE